jgi:hypothetical protein
MRSVWSGRRLAVAVVAIVAALVASGCSAGPTAGPDERRGPQDSQGPQQGRSQCEEPAGIARSTETPFGVLLPSGSFRFQSYDSAADVAASGLNAVSIGWSILYNDSGDIVFDRNGSDAGDAKARWLDEARCAALEAKKAGLIVSLWGQFQQAGVDGEPGLIREDIRERVLAASVDVIPDMAQLAEDVQAEYFSPVSELDKYAGIEGHNAFFPQYVAAARPIFSGILYSQPNILQRDPSFFSEKLTPALEGIDALGISWISYQCDPQDVEKTQWFIDQARSQGVNNVFISEIGDVQASSQTPCLEQLIEEWGGDTAGVFVLDSPPMMPNAAEIKGSWQEEVLLSYLN